MQEFFWTPTDTDVTQTCKTRRVNSLLLCRVKLTSVNKLFCTVPLATLALPVFPEPRNCSWAEFLSQALIKADQLRWACTHLQQKLALDISTVPASQLQLTLLFIQSKKKVPPCPMHVQSIICMPQVFWSFSPRSLPMCLPQPLSLSACVSESLVSVKEGSVCACLPRMLSDVLQFLHLSASHSQARTHSWFQKPSVSLLYILSFTYVYSFLRSVNICKIKLTFPVWIRKVIGRGKPVHKQDPSLFFFCGIFLVGKERNKTAAELGKWADRSVCSFWDRGSRLRQARKYEKTPRLQPLLKSHSVHAEMLGIQKGPLSHSLQVPHVVNTILYNCSQDIDLLLKLTQVPVLANTRENLSRTSAYCCLGYYG